MKNKNTSALFPAFFTSLEKAKDSINPFNILTIKRNCSLYPFPHKLSQRQSKDITKQVIKAFKKISTLKLSFFNEKKLSQQDRSLLLEHFMIDPPHHSEELETLFIVDESATFLALSHGENHLHLHYLAEKEHVKTAFTKLFTLHDTLSKSLDFSYNDKFGYLTANPHESGTGFITSCYLHLPALIHTQTFQKYREAIPPCIEVLGMHKHEQFIANVVHCKNRYTQGILEKTIFQQSLQARDALIQQELKARKKLLDSCNEELKDKVCRAFGLLSCASKLETKEALDALSLLELGQSLNLVKGLNTKSFPSLFFKAQRAHLPFFTPSLEGIQENRAKLLHEALKAAKLVL